MKPWLFNLLACPICKSFPLKLFIFSFETREELFEKYLKSYENNDLSYKSENQIPEIIEGDELYIRDNIIIEKKPLKQYLDKLISILNELIHIIDKTPYTLSKQCFNLAYKDIKNEFIEFSKNIKNKDAKKLLPELIFLNRLMVETEIEAGLLLCEKCNRWYPIIDTIPRMLPDEYRSKEEELEFLKAHKDSLNENFLDLDLKPFKL
ncbi:MAG: hypothetical protein EU541_07435 [Promethearchaeota archaeon]|nr:MAG: hypothetical protein EU541_07435 [Candidatus Lokiarchaeota archaeon]